MNSLLLQTCARILTPLQIVLAVLLLLRGHNEPGGGFIGGLVGAVAILLWSSAFGPVSARRLLRADPSWWIGIGLFLAAASSVPALGFGLPFMTGIWGPSLPFPLVGTVKLGTPFLFDLGVFFTVAGFVTMLAFALEEAD